jgi:hypothetical protein
MRLEWPDYEKVNPTPKPFQGIPNFEFHVDGVGVPGDSALTLPYVLYNYIINSKFGHGIDTNLIDVSSFIDASKILHSIVWSESDSSATFNASRYYRLDTTKSFTSNIKDLLGHMNAALIYVDGKYTLRINPNCMLMIGRNPFYNNYCKLFEVDEDNIIGGISYEAIPASEKIKQLIVKYFDTSTKEISITAKEVRDSFLWSAQKQFIDPNAEKVVTISANSDASRLLDIYRTMIIESHYGDTVTFKATPDLLNARIYDVVSITNDIAGLQGEKFYITDITYNPDFTVDVAAKRLAIKENVEINNLQENWERTAARRLPAPNRNRLLVPSGYGWDSNTQIDQFLPNTELPDKVTAIFVRDLKAESGELTDNTTDLEINWTTIDSNNEWGYQVYIQRISDEPNVWRWNGVVRNNTLTFTNARRGASYYISVFPRNSKGPIEENGKITTYTVDGIVITGEVHKAHWLLKDFEYNNGLGQIVEANASPNLVWGHLNPDIETGNNHDVNGDSYGTVWDADSMDQYDNDPLGLPDVGEKFTTYSGFPGEGTYQERKTRWGITWNDFKKETEDYYVNYQGVEQYKKKLHRTWLGARASDNWSNHNHWLNQIALIQSATYVGPTYDLKQVKEFYWTAEVKTTPKRLSEQGENFDVGTYYHAAFDVSNDMVTWNEGQPFANSPYGDVRTGRYIRPRVEIKNKDGSDLQSPVGILSFDMGIYTNEITSTFRIQVGDSYGYTTYNVATGEHTFAWDEVKFGKINNVTVNGLYKLVPTDFGPRNPSDQNQIKFKFYNQNNALISASSVWVEITVTGYPEVKQVPDQEGFPLHYRINMANEIENFTSGS